MGVFAPSINAKRMNKFINDAFYEAVDRLYDYMIENLVVVENLDNEVKKINNNYTIDIKFFDGDKLIYLEEWEKGKLVKSEFYI